MQLIKPLSFAHNEFDRLSKDQHKLQPQPSSRELRK